MFPTKKTPIPLAPAPIRAGTSGIPNFGVASVSNTKTIGEEGLLSSSSSDDDLHLVRPSPATGGRTPRATGLYAELGAENGEDNEGEVGAEEEFEVEEPGGEEITGANRDELIRERIATSQEQMKNILGSLTEEQLQRYETFRRVGFPRPMVKKLMMRVMEGLMATVPASGPSFSSTTGMASTTAASNKEKAAAAANLNPNTVIVMAGIAKVFVGELIEEGTYLLGLAKVFLPSPLPPMYLCVARTIQEEWGEESKGPLTPAHILEAQRRLKTASTIPPSCNYKRRCNNLL